MTDRPRIVFVVPDDIENPDRPSGGNEYDRRLAQGLRDAGWPVDLRPVAGPDDVGRALAGVPDGTVVLLDGLLAAPAAGLVTAHPTRLRVVVVMHMTMALPPAGHDRPGDAAAERSVLGVAAAVITTSQWLRHEIVTRQHIDPQRVSVAVPGVEQAPATVPSPSGNRLLCVAPVEPHKGHDVLVDALGRLSELDWSCRCVGPYDRAAEFAAAVRADAVRRGIGDRIAFTGVRTRAELADDYGAGDLLVLPTRSESYGMVLGEALARGLPVVASDVGGVVEAATGAPPQGDPRARFPGALVPPDDPAALAGRLREWLTDEKTRTTWRSYAGQRRARLHGWDVTARCVAEAIERAPTLVRTEPKDR